jgi:hypothetical protein
MLAVDLAEVERPAGAGQRDVECLVELLGNAEVVCEQVRGACRDDCDRDVGTRDGVEAALDQAVPTPGDDQLRACLEGVADAFWRLLALAHLVPEQVLDVVFGHT